MMIQPILPIYIYNKLKLDEKEVGLIIGSLGLTSLLVRLSFSLGLFPRNVVRGILIGLYLNAISIFGYWISNSSLLVWIFRMFHGMSWGINQVLMLTFPSLVSEDVVEKHISLTSYTIFVALGLCAGPAIAALSVVLVGKIYGVFIIAIGMSVTCLFIMNLTARSKLVGSTRKTLKISKGKIATLLKTILRPAIIFSSSGFILSAILSYGPLKASLELYLSEGLISGLFSLLYLAMLLSRVFLLTLKYRSKFLISLELIALILCAAGMLIVSLSIDLTPYAIGILLIGLGCGLIFPTTASEVVSKINDRFMVLGNTIYFIIYDIGYLTGAIFISLLLHMLPLAQAMALSIMVPLTCAVISYITSRVKNL
jgi:hypothetical protein